MPEMRILPYDGKKVRDLRERAGLTLVQLGALTGHHPKSLGNIEQNRKNASVVTLARIAKALEVDLDEITLTEPAQVAS